MRNTNTWNYLELNVGDSEMILVDELKTNPNHIYCDREAVEGLWPKTQKEIQDTGRRGYSRAKILGLLIDEGVHDRTITQHNGGVGFKKSG